MSKLPKPVIDQDVDLRDYPYMQLDVIRLRDSDLAGIATGDEFRAAVLLWCAAWHQVPAGSLPKDQRLLAHLAGYGRDMDSWNSVSEVALHGFIECNDGRLYHKLICEKAKEAWDGRIKRAEFLELQREKGTKGAAKRWKNKRKAKNGNGHDPANGLANSRGNGQTIAYKEEEEEEEEKKESQPTNQQGDTYPSRAREDRQNGLEGDSRGEWIRTQAPVLAERVRKALGRPGDPTLGDGEAYLWLGMRDDIDIERDIMAAIYAYTEDHKKDGGNLKVHSLRFFTQAVERNIKRRRDEPEEQPKPKAPALPDHLWDLVRQAEAAVTRRLEEPRHYGKTADWDKRIKSLFRQLWRDRDYERLAALAERYNGWCREWLWATESACAMDGSVIPPTGVFPGPLPEMVAVA